MWLVAPFYIKVHWNGPYASFIPEINPESLIHSSLYDSVNIDEIVISPMRLFAMVRFNISFFISSVFCRCSYLVWLLKDIFLI